MNTSLWIASDRLRRKAYGLLIMMGLLPTVLVGQISGPVGALSQRITSLQNHTMNTITLDFDALRKSHWSEQDLAHAELLADFVQQLMNNHDFDYVRDTFMNPYYVQHNRNMPDGMAGVLAYVEDFAKRYPEYAYDVKNIYVDGDHVTFHSHVTLKAKDRGNEKKGLIIMDTWRVENGQIVEHWDAIQPLDGMMRLFILLNGGKVRNTNSIF